MAALIQKHPEAQEALRNGLISLYENIDAGHVERLAGAAIPELAATLLTVGVGAAANAARRSGTAAKLLESMQDFGSMASRIVGKVDDVVPNKVQMNSGGDRLIETMGSARFNNADEFNAIIYDLHLNNVEIDFRSGQFAYGPAGSPGRTGNIIFDQDASLSAIKHEYGHFLDDQALGFPGQRFYYENPELRLATERRQYLQEIRTAREFGDDAARKQLILDYSNEKQYLIDNYYFKSDGTPIPYGSRL
jgi:hypothetical protein